MNNDLFAGKTAIDNYFVHSISNTDNTTNNYVQISCSDTFYQVKFKVTYAGHPIKNAKINMDGYGVKNTTDEGIAIFKEVLPTDSLYYAVKKQGYENFADSIAVHSEDVEERVELKKRASSVEFMVKSTGKPVAGAEVYLEGYGANVTDSSGRTVFDSVENADAIYYTVTATNYKFYQDSVKVVNHTVELVKLEKMTFRVKFIIKKDEAEIPEATVWLSGYGEKLTNSEGQAVFDSVSPGYGIPYKVLIKGYSEFLNAINVIDKDVVEEVEFAPPTYSVFFRVMANGKRVKEASVELEGYGTEITNKNGECFFRNVNQKENIPYTIITEQFPEYSSTVTVVNDDVHEEVSLTGLNSQVVDQINLHPIPTGSMLYFYLPINSNISVFSSQGYLIYKKHMSKGSGKIDVSEFNPGIYLYFIDQLGFSQPFVVHRNNQL